MSKIEWTNETWNPIVGCSKVSEGCLNCYAEKMAYRLGCMGHSDYEFVTYSPYHSKKGQWTGNTFLREKILEKPLHWKKPKMIFVCSMSDLFLAPFEWIGKVIRIIDQCPQHTFQILTKRSKRLLEFSDESFFPVWTGLSKWPENIIGMVTTENQRCANERITDLLQCGFKTTGVSMEPLLEDIDLEKLYYKCVGQTGCGHIDISEKFNNPEKTGAYKCPNCGKNHTYKLTELLEEIDWVIVGCESGPGRRPCKLEWVRNIFSQCRAAEVPVFVKQLNINGKVEHDIEKFPKDFRFREYPNPKP